MSSRPGAGRAGWLTRPTLARVAPFAAFMAVLALRGAWPADGTVAGWADPRWLYALQAGSAAVLLAWFARDYVELRPRGRWRVDARSAGRWTLFAAIGVAIGLAWVELTASWMRLEEPVARFVPLAPDGTLDVPLAAVRLAGAVLVVPLMEELFWRSWLMRWLDAADFLAHDPAQGSIRALVASSVVFALAHDQWLAGLLAGLVFAALYRVTRSLWAPVIAHAAANLALGLHVLTRQAWSFW